MISADRIPTALNPLAHRKRWTADECRKLEAMELLVPGTYELMDGEVMEKVGQNASHSVANLKTLFALSLTFGQDYVMMTVSVAINDADRPEPDAIVTVSPRNTYLLPRNPTPSDIRLAVEVSDTTLWYDRNTKMRLYSAAGIPEYWVLDVEGRRLFVHRNPEATGYGDITEYDETRSMTTLAAPDNPINVADLLP